MIFGCVGSHDDMVYMILFLGGRFNFNRRQKVYSG